MFSKKPIDQKYEIFVIGQCYKINGKKVGKFIGIDKKRIDTDQKDHIADYGTINAIIFIFDDNGKINDSYAEEEYNYLSESMTVIRRPMFGHTYQLNNYGYYNKFIRYNDNNYWIKGDWKAEIDTCSSGGRRRTRVKKAFRRRRTLRK